MVRILYVRVMMSRLYCKDSTCGSLGNEPREPYNQFLTSEPASSLLIDDHVTPCPHCTSPTRFSLPSRTPRLRPFVLRLCCPDRPLFPSNFSSQCTSFLTAEDTWIAQAPPADVTSTRRLESCHSMSHTTCTAHRKSGPCSGLYFRWKYILLYVGSINSFVHSVIFFSS